MSHLHDLQQLLSQKSVRQGRVIAIHEGIVRIATPSGVVELPMPSGSPLQVGEQITLQSGQVIKQRSDRAPIHSV
uniref:Uncharacterized protein n=1 Tax=Magnetococcus massalia (strain MO-1) TaxID=451514 RepID=A0A1S7LKA8_MAGMO|nr:Conserved protein of unknown function [Candidatus Magnetococcus massalia]